MKVAVLSPTTSQLVEKMAALFPEGIDFVGPQADDRLYWNNCHLRVDSWRELGLKVTIREEPYEAFDFSEYDLLVESVETFQYSREWRKHCLRLECPIVLKACWTGSPEKTLPPRYMDKARHFPILLEMPAHAANWKAQGFTDVNVIPNPVGDWWFEREWTGDKEQALFVLSGKDKWRGINRQDLDWKTDPSWLGLDLWDELCRRFPGRTHHHDGDKGYRTPQQMTELFSESRLFVNFDKPYGLGERPLTLAFTEALSAGLPVAARDLPGLNYHQYIDSNGVCTEDFEKICSFVDKCLSDKEFARGCSIRSREIGRQSFSTESLRARYADIVSRAQATFTRTPSRRRRTKGLVTSWLGTH